MAISDVKALTFDVFGTVVNWRDSIAREVKAFLGVVGELTWAGIRQIFHRHAEACGDFARHVRRYSLGIARRALSGDQQEIAHIDRRAQHAGRGKFGFNVSRHGGLFRNQ